MQEQQTRYYRPVAAIVNVFAFLVLLGLVVIGGYFLSRLGVARTLQYLDAMIPAAQTKVTVPTMLPLPTRTFNNGGGFTPHTQGDNTSTSPASDPVATPPPLQAPAAELAPANLAPSLPSDNPGYDGASADPGCDAACAAASQELSQELHVQQQINSLYMPDENTGKNPNLGPSSPDSNPGFTSDVETQP